MKKSIYLLIKRALVPLFLLMVTIANAQPVAQIMVTNDTLLSSKIFRFDLYIRAKAVTVADTINLNNYNGVVKLNLTSVKNGTINAAWLTKVAGSSELDVAFQPGNLAFKALVASPKYTQLIGPSPSGNSTTLYNANNDPLGKGGWRRIITEQIADTGAFRVGTMDIYNGDDPTTYHSIVNAFVNAVSTSISFDTLTVRANPILNGPIAKFNVTGSGSYAGTSGLPVGLDGSEIGCAYKLRLNGTTISTLNEIKGTGAAISWPNQLIGTYTVVARRIATYEVDTLMNGNAVLTVASNAPGAAGTITGPTTVCQGQSNITYQTTHIQYADNTVWTYSGTGITIVSVNDTTQTISYGNSATSGYLKIYGHNSLGNGAADSMLITVNPLPLSAGTITGNASVNSGDVQTYIVPPIANATSYTWTYTGTGIPLTSVTTTDTLIVTFASSGSTGGNLTVKAQNSCGFGTISSLFAISVAAAPPAAAGTIVGTTSSCTGTNLQFSVPPIAGVTTDTSGYVWNYTGTGATWTKSITGDTINVSFSSNATSGVLTVQGHNLNGYGTVSPNDSITINQYPASAGIITGNTNPCLNTSTTYTVGTIANATAYVWTTPSGATGSSSTNSITLSFATAGIGSITVKGQNACGFGAVSTLADTAKSVPTIASDPILGFAAVCQGYTNVQYNLTTVIPGATSYVWTLPSGVQQTGGTAALIDTLAIDTIKVNYVNYTTSSLILKVNGLNSCGLGTQFSTTISVNPLPVAAAAITGPTPMCQGDSNYYRTTAIQYATSYVWTTPTGTTYTQFTDTIKVKFSTTAVSGNITVKGSNSCGSGTISSFAVSVSPLPNIAGAITGLASVCPGQNAVTYWVHKATNATAYQWTLPTGFTGTSTDTTITVNVSTSAVSGTVSVTPHDSCGYATAATTLAVTVNPAPAITFMTKTSCSGTLFSSTPLNGTNGVIPTGTTYSWVIPTVTGGITGGAASSGSPTSISGTLVNPTGVAQTAIYTVIPTSGLGCVGSSFTVTDTVNPAPAITTMTAYACSGSLSTVTPVNGTNGIVLAGTTYSWAAPTVSGSMTGGTSGSSASSITGTLVNPTNIVQVATYTVTPTGGGCTGATFTLRDTINPKPSINTMTTAACSGFGFTLTPVNSTNGIVPAGTLYSWNSPTVTGGMTGAASGSAASSITGTLSNLSASAQTATYTVTPVTGLGCTGSTFQITATVNVIPAAPALTLAQQTIGYCLNATPSALTATGTSKLWYTVATGGTGTSTAPTPVTSTVGTFYYYVTQTLNSCESLRDTITVNVTSPALPTVTHMYYCNNAASVPLVATPSTGGTIKWYNVATLGTAIPTPTPSTATVGNVFYWATQTINSCESQRAADTVTTYAIPTAPTCDIPAPGYYCQGAPTSALTTNGGFNILWYTTITGGTGSSTAPVPPTTVAGDTYLYVSQTVNNCESPRFEILVSVYPTPDAPGVSNPGNYCQGSIAAQLSASGTALLWYPTATGGTGSATAPTPSTAIAGTFNFYVTQSIGCESARDSITVTVIATPVAPTVSNISYCQNATSYPLTAGGINLKWYTLPTTGTGTSIAPTPSTSTLTPKIWYVSQTVNGCESPRNQITVTINAIPSTPTFTTPPAYCQFATAAPLSANGTNLLWYTNANGGTGSTTALTPSTAVVGISNYYVSQSTNGCESPRADIQVTTNGTLAPIVSDPSAYCQNATAASLVSNAIGTSLLWYADSTGGTGSSTLPTVSTTVAGSFYFYVSQTQNGCESPRGKITVTVNPTPALPTVSNIAYCNNSTTTVLTATATGTLLWYTNATGGTGSLTAPFPSASIVGDNNYYVSQTLLGCEGPRAVITVTTNAIPAEPTASNPAAYCENSTAIALTAQGANLLWYTAANGGTGSTTAIVPVTTPTGNHFYYVSQSVLGCESQRKEITVTVNPIPVEPGVSNISYCDNASATALTTNSGTNLLWYYAATGGTGSSTAIIPTTSIVGDSNYYVSQTVLGCESQRATITVTTNPIPTAPIVTNPAPICQYSVASALTTQSGTSLLWYHTATGGTGTTTAIIPTTLIVGDSNYYVSQTLLGCESPRADIMVTVKISPLAPTVTTPVIYCQDATASALTVNSGNNLLWYDAATGGIGSTTAIIPQTANAVPTDYYVSQTENGCEGPRATIVVDVNPLPVITAMTSTTCSATSFTVTPLNGTNGTIPTGTTYSWLAPTVSGGITGGAASTGNPTSIGGSLINTTTTAQTATYTVTPTANGCAGATFTVTVTVNPVPTITAMTTTICSGSLFTTTPTGVPTGTTYSWTTPVVTGGITGGAAGNGSNITGTLTNPTNTIQTATYTVIPIAGTCTGATFTVTVTVNPIPVVSNMTTSVCSGTAFTATPTTVPAGTTYSWLAPTVTGGVTGGIASTGNPTNISGTLTNPTFIPQTATYTVTPSANGCPGATFTVTVTINTVPAAAGTITGITALACTGATGLATIPAINGATSYAWSYSTAGLITGTSTTYSLSYTVGTTIGLDTIKVHGVNGCGSGTSSSFAVAIITTPPTPVITEADATVIPHQGIVKIYKVTPYIPGTTYTWSSTTTRVTLLPLTTTDSVQVTFLPDQAINGNLTVTASNACGSSLPSSPITWSITGINESINNLSYHIYPNPTNGLLNIEMDGITDNIELAIVNPQGAVIAKESISRNNSIFKKEVDLSTYARGIYFVRIISKNFTKVEKIVVQ